MDKLDRFLFRFEYIDGIPKEEQEQYICDIIDYAQYGKEPVYKDWKDKRAWSMIKAQIDKDYEQCAVCAEYGTQEEGDDLYL